MTAIAVLAIGLVPMLAAPGRAQSARSESGGPLTLDTAVALALQHNRLRENAALEIEKAEETLRSARTRRFPSFSFDLQESYLTNEANFSFPAGAFGTFASTGPIPPGPSRITVTPGFRTVIFASVGQPLTQLRRIGLGIQQAEINHNIAEARLTQQEQTLVNDVKRLYYSALQTRAAIDTNRKTIELYEEIDTVVGHYVQQRAALRSDELEIHALVAKEQVQLLTTEDRLASLKEQLNVLLGRDVSTNFEVMPAADVTGFAVDLAEADKVAVQQRPEVKEAAMKLRQAELDLQSKRSERIPDVTLTANYVGLYNITILPDHLFSWGVKVSWEPLDWGRRRREEDIKGRVVQQARNGLAEAEARVVADVNAQGRKLREAQAALRAARAAQEASREKARVAMERYRVQRTLYKDALQAQGMAMEAEHQYLDAELAFWSAKADFERAMGER